MLGQCSPAILPGQPDMTGHPLAAVEQMHWVVVMKISTRLRTNSCGADMKFRSIVIIEVIGRGRSMRGALPLPLPGIFVPS